MNLIQQNVVSTNIMAKELGISESEVESYYRNYYINRTLPIRDLTPNEMKLVKWYNEIKFANRSEQLDLCAKYHIAPVDFMADMWILPKALMQMPDDEYSIAMRYASLLLEPYINYGNYKAPRLTPLTKEEIAMLLSNIAVGITILPDDQITTRISMEAMDRLLVLYDTLGPNKDADKANEKLKNLSPAQLEQLINQITAGVKTENVPVVPKDLKTSIKKPREKKTKNILTQKEQKVNARNKRAT